MIVNVQFTGADKKVICGYLSDYQEDEDAYPNQGQVELSDERWKAYYQSLNPMFQQLVPEPE